MNDLVELDEKELLKLYKAVDLKYRLVIIKILHSLQPSKDSVKSGFKLIQGGKSNNESSL